MKATSGVILDTTEIIDLNEYEMMFKTFLIAPPITSILATTNCFAIPICFKSADEKIKLKLDTPAVGKTIGSVQYKRGSSPIKIRKVSEKIITPSGGTSATLTVFDELEDGKVTGQYDLIKVGANVGGLTYKKHKRRKQYEFIDDQDASTGDGCTWN